MTYQEKQKASVLAALAFGTVLYSAGAITPAIAGISAAFPQSDPLIIKMIITLPSLLMVFSSLLMGTIERFLDRKQIALAAMIFLFLGGISPAFGGGVIFILTARAVSGVGLGLAFGVFGPLLASVCNPDERSKFLGYGSAVGGFGGIIYQLLGAFLCGIFWRNGFYSYALIIPVFFLILFFLPPSEKVIRQKKNTQVEKAKLGTKIYMLGGFSFLLNLLFFSLITNASIVMETEKIGNAASVGAVMTLFTIGGMIGGITFGKISKRLKRNTVSAGILLAGAAFAIWSNTSIFLFFCTAGLLYGLGFAFFNTFMINSVIESAAPSASGRASGYYWAMTGLGQFLSPIILTAFAGFLGMKSIRSSWIIAAVGLLAVSGISFAFILFTQREFNAQTISLGEDT